MGHQRKLLAIEHSSIQNGLKVSKGAFKKDIHIVQEVVLFEETF
jgi:hypothetical protein